MCNSHKSAMRAVVRMATFTVNFCRTECSESACCPHSAWFFFFCIKKNVKMHVVKVNVFHFSKGFLSILWMQLSAKEGCEMVLLTLYRMQLL